MTHSKKFKTVGEAAIAVNENRYQEVGETVAEMSKSYDKEMRAILEKHKSINKYYIIVLRKKEPLSPSFPVSNVMRQWFVAPRLTKPSAKTLKRDYPLHDHDVWLIKNGEHFHQWTLPGPDAWTHILKNKSNHDPDLVKWMMQFESGALK